jgi:hypothetical protein
MNISVYTISIRRSAKCLANDKPSDDEKEIIVDQIIEDLKIIETEFLRLTNIEYHVEKCLTGLYTLNQGLSNPLGIKEN